jgi:RNA polymerase sigma-70 factor (ECF subfamily)
MERPEKNPADEPRDVAIARLFELHGARVFALARRLCRTHEEAEDLVQEVFLAAHRHWDQFEGRGDASAWLWTIAARACARMHRRRAGEPLHTLSLDADDGAFERAELGVADDTSVDAAARAELVERVRAALAELPDEHRVPLVLKDVVGLSVDETATALDVPAGTVKSRVHRARLALRTALERGLPRRRVPPAAFDRAVCLDLLRTKQDALDRGVVFPVANEVVCERCNAVFGTMDLAQELCRELGSGPLPPGLAARVERGLAEAGRSTA